ncbi:VanZ family protein [Alkalicoccus luteus]|uniref:VanZ family protein n=1 Tax=Alkalicoccus luteus TaxID=1237094 RepID=A0A969PSB5_9BACI|nr:VanZ family protein [Alkalicoccus luteus]NJP38625.1 VanZ family protein [Alkalicoccus luteus]
MKTIVTSWALVLAWMGLIFYFSHQPGDRSGEMSSGVLQALTALLPFEPSETFHFLLRKSAHFTVYAVLGILLLRALKLHASGKKAVAWALLISCLYAVSDEYHQTFIPGRSGEVGDVLIDTVGAGSGILVYIGVRRLLKRQN